MIRAPKARVHIDSGIAFRSAKGAAAKQPRVSRASARGAALGIHTQNQHRAEGAGQHGDRSESPVFGRQVVPSGPRHGGGVRLADVTGFQPLLAFSSPFPALQAGLICVRAVGAQGEATMRANISRGDASAFTGAYPAIPDVHRHLKEHTMAKWAYSELPSWGSNKEPGRYRVADTGPGMSCVVLVYSTVTLLARLRGWSTSQPRLAAM